jgi:hypothetical protein
MFTRDFWVKKVEAPGVDKDARRREKEEAARIKSEERKKRQERDELEEEEEEKKKKDKSAAPQQELTPEMVSKKLRDLLAARGKKGTDRSKVIDELKVLVAAKNITPVVQLKARTFLVSALFDLTLNTGTHMSTKDWKACGDQLIGIMLTLKANPMIRFSEDLIDVKEAFEDDGKLDDGFAQAGRLLGTTSVREAEERKKKAAEEAIKRREEAEAAAKNEVQYVIGNLFSFIRRMVDEYRKALQSIDAHSSEYITRLTDETALVELVSGCQEYYNRLGKPDMESKAALLRLELAYYLVPRAASKKEKKDDVKESIKKFQLPEAGLVAQLSEFIYRHGDPLSRMQALLYQVYHLAITNEFQRARDLLLMSHIQDNIHAADINSKIIFNRTMAQIGLCAFRVGETRQALYCLGDLYQSGRIKELLAQGVSSARYHERDEKQEKLEKERQYPYHMHINLDMLEAVHLLSAMFVEVPNLALHGSGNKRRVISKAFRRLFDHHQKQAFNGPPENTRDNVMAATKALQVGDWKKCVHHVNRLRMWDLMRGAEECKELMKRKIQEEALKSYLLTYAPQYMSISAASLREMFELPAVAIHKIASKMMVIILIAIIYLLSCLNHIVLIYRLTNNYKVHGINHQVAS